MDNKWFRVRKDTVELPNGTVVDDYFVWEEGDVVLIVPVTHSNEFVLVKQYKHGAAEIVTEFPAGMLEHEEPPEEGAVRELREETGYTAQKLELIGKIMNNPSKSAGTIFVFLATGAQPTHSTSFDQNEHIEVIVKPQNEVLNMIYTGEIRVTGSISGAFLAINELQRR